jgi:hypothetical protein
MHPLLRLLPALAPSSALACGACRPLVLARIAAEPWLPLLAVLLAPLAVLALIAAVLHHRVDRQ